MPRWKSADVGEATLELAEVQSAAGDAANPHKTAAMATISLRNGFGAAHERTRRAQQLALVGP